MTWPAARHDEQRVDADVVPVVHEARTEPLCGNSDASEAPVIEGECGSVLCGSGLNFHERHGPSAPRDNVDLSTWHASAPRKDAPPFKTKVPAGEGLRPATALFGGLTVQRERSSALA